MTCCGGCALRLENTAGDSWSMGLAHHQTELKLLNAEFTLIKESFQAAPVDLGLIPFGIEVSVGAQKQVRGFVLPNSATNRAVAPRGIGMGKKDGWYFGITHCRIPRENHRVHLVANTVKGGAFRIAGADPYFKIGSSKTTATMVTDENINGTVEYVFTPSAPDFNFSIQPTLCP